MPVSLSANVNAIAELRNRRNLPWPSVVDLSRIALSAGAAGITVHPRPDERHIRPLDVTQIAEMIAAEFPEREYNIEGNPDARFVELVERVRPNQVTGISVITGISSPTSSRASRTAACAFPSSSTRSPGRPPWPARWGPIVSRFIPVPTAPDVQRLEFERVVATGRAAAAEGIGLNAGHDLTLNNLPPLVSALPNLLEVSIGHCLTADALIYGMEGAVDRYLKACAR
jgi:pyridoxine 5-phosphate synthase